MSDKESLIPAVPCPTLAAFCDINSTIRVKLTDIGRERHKHRFIPNKPPAVDDDGWTYLQLWQWAEWYFAERNLPREEKSFLSTFYIPVGRPHYGGEKWRDQWETHNANRTANINVVLEIPGVEMLYVEWADGLKTIHYKSGEQTNGSGSGIYNLIPKAPAKVSKK